LLSAKNFRKNRANFEIPINKKRGFISKATRLTGFIFLLLIIYILFTFSQVYFAARNDTISKNTKADVVLVLGAAQFNGKPSKVLQARLDYALELYRKTDVKYIVVTGGKLSGDISSEASASANYLLQNGVDDSKILREVNGSSTYDSLQDSAKFLKEKNLTKVILVTDGFHQLRSKLIAQEFGLTVITAPAKNSPIKGANEWKNFITETARVSLGRIIGFRRVSRDSSLAHLIK
jgi:uncharacterized SAM-binding protein YcdF (DUF218 family)